MAVISVLFNFLDQNGINTQCADPVTGSSFTPNCGAKNLDTKSTFFPFAVMIKLFSN